MLARAITNVAHKLGQADGDNSVRLFFQTQVCTHNCKNNEVVICFQLYHMDALFDELRTLAENVGYEHNQLTTKAMAVMECSQILLVRLSATCNIIHVA
jgi:hypothetical protein